MNRTKLTPDQEGSLLRLHCATNCPHVWTFYGDKQSGDSRRVASEFVNPPYFYIMVRETLGPLLLCLCIYL